MGKITYVFAFFLFWGANAQAGTDSAERRAPSSGEALYRALTAAARGDEGKVLFRGINAKGQALDWGSAEPLQLEGTLRRVRSDGKNIVPLYLLRETSGALSIIALPADMAALEDGADSPYAGLDGMLEGKHRFEARGISATVEGRDYRFVQLTKKPEKLLFDVIFKISSVLMLFAVMAGMGMSLRPKDFSAILARPWAILVGTLIQFGLMPLCAFGLAHLFAVTENMPFVFAGVILVTAVPGGATSNLMTHMGKGDVALSISLTASATVLSLFLTPALLALYASNIPQVEMPVKMLVSSIFVLVLVPLLIGMAIRAKAPALAEKGVRATSIVGLLALLLIFIGGIVANLDKLLDFERNGPRVWGLCLALTATGMIMGVLVPKLARIDNYQTRAIAMEVGIRNVVLGMVIAILIQDSMGDFHSSMFAVTGIFALIMYLAGFAAIAVHRRILPATPAEE